MEAHARLLPDAKRHKIMLLLKVNLLAEMELKNE